MKHITILIAACSIVFGISCKEQSSPSQIISCKAEMKQVRIISAAARQADKYPATCPSFTTDNKGRVILSWVRMMNDSSAVFCYAKSSDNGSSFDETHVVSSSGNIHPHSENLPRVVVKPSGDMLAIWGAGNPNPRNKYSGLIYYAQSFDDGKTWSEARELVRDTASYDQRYSDVDLLANGEVAVIWLDNRKTTNKEGAALYFAVTNGRNGFMNEKRISQPACPCCRTDLFVDSRNNIHALYRGIINDSIRDMVHIVSEDGGKTFTTPAKISNDNWVLNACPHTGPAMTENNRGLHFAWYTGGTKKGSFYTRSADNGRTFNETDSISNLGMHPQLSALANGELVAVWDEAIQGANRFYKRIGIQVRNTDGAGLTKTFISQDTAYASYPVVVTVNKNASLVAYCQKEAEKNYVVYQQVSFKQ